MNNSEQLFMQLNQQINIAKQNNQPYDHYIRQQISMLEQQHDKLMYEAKKKGYNLYSPELVKVELLQYAAMTKLAAEINLPTEKYDIEIQRLLKHTLSEEDYNKLLAQFPEEG